MVAERLDIRLDRAYREKLISILEARHTTVTSVVQAGIDQTYAELEGEQRRQAAQRLTNLQIGEVPDAEALKQQLSEAYDPGPLR